MTWLPSTLRVIVYTDDPSAQAPPGGVDVVVLDRNRYQEWIPNLEQTEPAAYSYITNLLDREFKLAYQNRAYKIYLRSITAPGAVSE